MKQRNRFQRFSFRIGNMLDLIIGPSIIGFGAITGIESHTYEKWPDFIRTLILWCQDNSLVTWSLLGIFSLLGWWLRRRGDPWVWDKLQALLDKFQEVAYKRFPNHIKDDHRVTLFKHRRVYWSLKSPMVEGRWPWSKKRLPWSGWLVPVLRSGKTSQKTKAVFMVPDNGNEAEGVAGEAWASNSIVVADRLPAIVPQSGDRQVARYAERTHCPEQIVRSYMRRSRPLPRSIAAIPIEVNNVSWGVLVLDSCHEEGVTRELVENFTLIVQSISQLLEKAK